MSIVRDASGVYLDTDTGRAVVPYGSGYLDSSSGAVMDSSGRIIANLRTGVGTISAPNAAPAPPNPAGSSNTLADVGSGILNFVTSIAPSAAKVGTAAIEADAARRSRTSPIVLGPNGSSQGPSLGTVVLVGGGLGAVALALYWIFKR